MMDIKEGTSMMDIIQGTKEHILIDKKLKNQNVMGHFFHIKSECFGLKIVGL